jgi:hypothetical protein
MAEAIREVDAIDPFECRRAAELRFSADRVMTGYLGAFDRVLRAARCAALLDSVFEALATPDPRR